MGFDITWQDNNGVTVIMDGDIDARELGHANNRLYADERFEQLKYQIFDMSKAKVSLTKQNVIEIGALNFASTRWNNSIHVALITPNDDLNELIEKYYLKQMEKSGWVIQVFNIKEEAIAWVESIV